MAAPLEVTSVSYTHLDVYKRQELGAAAIDHQQVRSAAEPLVGHALGGVATSENLSLIHI